MWPSAHDVLAFDDHTSCTPHTPPVFRGALAASYEASLQGSERVLLLVRDLPSFDLEARRVAVQDSYSHSIFVISKGKAHPPSLPSGYRDSASRAAPLRHFLFAPRPGVALSSLVLTARQSKPWPLAEACSLVAELAMLLPHAERIHADPCTMGLDAEGLWTLHPTLDLFLRSVRQEAREPVKWLGYQAPETLRGAPCGEASAVFGLGVLLHELMAGRALFDRPSALLTLKALAHDTPAPLSWLVSGTPLPVAACVQAMLDRDPLRRPQLAAVTRELAPFSSRSEAWKTKALSGPRDNAPFLARL